MVIELDLDRTRALFFRPAAQIHHAGDVGDHPIDHLEAADLVGDPGGRDPQGEFLVGPDMGPTNDGGGPDVDLLVQLVPDDVEFSAAFTPLVFHQGIQIYNVPVPAVPDPTIGTLEILTFLEGEEGAVDLAWPGPVSVVRLAGYTRSRLDREGELFLLGVSLEVEVGVHLLVRLDGTRHVELQRLDDRGRYAHVEPPTLTLLRESAVSAHFFSFFISFLKTL